MLLITNADQFMGYAIASHMAQYEHLRPQIRVLCEKKDRCYGFTNAGIDVRQVDYNHPNQLSLALRGVDHLILAIGNESNRVENAKHICTVAAHSGVSNIICISHIGAVSHVHHSLQEYNTIEKQVIDSNCQYTILRLDFVQQYLHLWSNYAEKNRELLMPLTEDIEMCPIDITDVCSVVEKLVLDGQKLLLPQPDDQHDGQVYSLTGPESISGKRMVELLAHATGYEQFKYCHGRPMDLNYYLSGLSKDVWFDARLKREMSHIYHDTYDKIGYNDKAYCIPTDKQVQTYLDYFDWIQQNAGSVCVAHTTMLTQLPAKSVQAFFEQHANSFKPRV